MVVGNVLSQQSAKVTLVEEDGLIEQFATYASDPALCDTVLPRASEGRPRWAHAEGIHRCEDPVAEYRVAVEDQMAHGGIVRECFTSCWTRNVNMSRSGGFWRATTQQRLRRRAKRTHRQISWMSAGRCSQMQTVAPPRRARLTAD